MPYHTTFRRQFTQEKIAEMLINMAGYETAAFPRVTDEQCAQIAKSCHLPHAVTHMEVLLDTQRKTVKDLNNYIQKETDRLDIIERQLNRYKTEQEIAMQDVPNYLGNPLNAYTLIKRLTTDLSYVERKIRDTTVFVKDTKLTYPSMEDFVGAIRGLVRLHGVYNLNLTEIANGKLVTNYTSDGKEHVDLFSPLTAADCFEIASGFYNEKAHKTGVQWMILAYDKFKQDRDESFGLKEADLVRFICFGYYTIDSVPEAIYWTRKFISLKPNDSETPRYAALMNKYKARLAQEEKMIKEGKRPKKPVTDEMLLETEPKHKVFNSYCRNEGPGLPANISKSLTCSYLSGPHPFLRLARIKLEQLYPEPALLLLHDVITDREIQYLINNANPRLSRAKIKPSGSAKAVETERRVAKNSYHQDNESDTIERLTRRIGHFTQLNMETGEPLQVSNYGFAGNFDPHFDFCENGCDTWVNGNRMASVIFYLSEVAQGGATVFDQVGVTVYPKKGSALFFMNLDEAGKIDRKTHHGACPVLQGSKWVALKWIREKGQIFTRPCDPLRYKKNISSMKLPYFKNKFMEIKFHQIE